MTSFFRTFLICVLFAGLLVSCSPSYAALSEEESQPSPAFYAQGSPRSYHDAASPSSPSFSPLTQESPREHSPSPRPLVRTAPWVLSQVIVDSWGLTDLNDIGPVAEVAARLQHALPDELVTHIMVLGAQYVHESYHHLTIEKLIEFLSTLGQIEERYPRSPDPLSSAFAYNVMIEEHRRGSINSWEHQSHYLWCSAHVLHKTGSEGLANDILKWSTHFIYPHHTYDQQWIITKLVQDITLHNPTGYASFFSSVLHQTRDYESFQIIPFLEGCRAGLVHRPPSPAFSPMWSPGPTPGYESRHHTPLGAEDAARTPGYYSSGSQTPLGWRSEEHSPYLERQTSEKEAHADWRYFNRDFSHDADDERTDTPPAEENLE